MKVVNHPRSFGFPQDQKSRSVVSRTVVSPSQSSNIKSLD